MVTPSLLQALGPSERTALEGRLHHRRFGRGETIFHDGDRGDCMYLVHSGRLDVQTTTSEGHMIVLRVIHPGEIFGELALVHADSVRTGRVCALEDAVLSMLTRRDFEDLRTQHPGVDRFLVAVLAERVVRTTDLAVQMLLPPEVRLWKRLAVLADAYGSEPIKMPQEALAQAAGTVRQTANRVLRAGVKDGILALDRGTIRILDRTALELRASS